MADTNLRIGIVGVTGAVGRVALSLLEDRDWPAEGISAMASARSAGTKLPYGDAELTVSEATPDSFGGLDVAFISANSAVSRELAPVAVLQGALVIDDSSAFRMEPDVPLVVPEVNGADVEWHRGIISIPNCTTTPLAMALAALNTVNPVRRVTAATYQAVSGTGAAAVQELEEQTAAVVAGEEVTPRVYPHQIALSVLPHVDDFTDDGYTVEEHKMVNETRKIMHMPDLPISATCVRVPVPISHSAAVHAELDRPMAASEVRGVLDDYPGIAVVDDPKRNIYPLPHHAAGRDDVLIGRIRQDMSHPNGIAFWLSCDNLRKGAALNALQIMDEVIRRECLRPVTAASAAAQSPPAE